ncbi:MAG: GEVED domain-containing protein, partial [Planctomycetota bacterium]
MTAPHPFLQLPPVGNPAAGVVRNLPVANDSVLGGLMPGVVIRNNTIDQAGQSGVKVEGESRPFVIENFPFGSFLPDADDAEDLEILLSSGNGVVDGFAIAIDAGGTRVVFEFEDVAGIDVMDGGSGVAGGDGFADGHVPVFYRHIGLGGYNDPPDDPQERDYPYNSFELLLALQQAIQGSILVTNDSVELVTPTLGPSMNTRNGFFEEFQPTPEYFPTPALYLEGVTQIYQTNVYSKLPAGALSISQLEVAEAPQPLARVVNNSIYGADGTESAFPESAASDGNDLLANATVTHVGRAHTGAYVQTATIGDQNLEGVDAINDVDFYQVELMVGDRLIVDIDTALNGPSTAVQIIDESGVRISLDGSTVASTGFAPDHLNLSGSIIDETVGDTTQDDLGIDAGSPLLRRADPFVDFTATASGTYYIAVSSLGNTDFDPENVSGRSGGIGGLGDYQIGIEAYAPRSFVVSLDDGVEGEGNLGTTGADVIGTTFTITQIPDFLPNTPNYGPGFGGSPNTDGNQLTFEFTDTLTGTIAPSGNINVPLLPEHRTQDIMRAISNAITGVVDPIARIDTAPLPNHEDGNGPGGINGPISRATAQAIGGSMGDNLGIVNLSDPSRRPGILRTLPPLHYILQNDTDFFGSYLGLRNSEGGFGHSRREADLSIELIPAGTVTDSLGTSELYVKIDNVAGITLSDEAIAAGLRLTPDAAKPEFAQNADQIIPESGIWISNGASPTVFNNALSNLHQSILSDETSITGFGQRVLSDPSGDLTAKPQEIVIVGNAFQYDESRNTEPRFNLTWPVDTIEPLDVIDTGISTDAIVGATNVASDSDDFNFVADNGNPYFVDAAGNDFQPAPGSILIDSGVSEVTERGDFETLKASVGLPPSNILAPQRDVFGVLRVDNRDFASPGAVGEDVFVDRGSVELGDFIGPSAIAVTPTDNDAAGLDADENVSVIDRLIGGLTEFQIQLVDTADAGNPFTGIGVDDQTVIVPEIDGLRLPGAKLAVFENDVLLEEGVDYTFSYDSTANLITLTPLAGVWDDQSSYRVSLNNRDRSVLVAPSPTQINDGDQLRVTDSDGGTVVFEFESGFQLFLPETLSLTVPSGDGNALRDGDVFQIIDSQGRQLTFEFDRDGFTLSDEIFINTPAVAAPSIPSEFDALVAEFVSDISDAITGSGLAASVAVVGDQIVVEARGGATITSETITGDTDGVVIENGDTLRFDLPDSGGAFDANLRGIDFIMSVPRPNQQTLERTFAFAAGGAASQLGAVPVIGLDAEPETSNPDVLADFRDQIVTRLAAAINASGLSVEASPVVIDGDANGRSDRVAVAAETGARINTASSRLMPNVRTLALRIPEGGTAAGAIEDGNQFTISNGIETVIFEYSFIGGDADGVLNNPNAIPIVLDIADGALSGLQVANATSTALAGSSLRLVPSLSGQNLFLNLPIDGSAEVNSGPIQVVAVARPVQDGDTIQIAQAPEAASPAIEILTSFPTEQPVAISGGLVDGEILTIQNVSGDLIRIELFASEEPREQIGDRRLLDITEVITPENGDSILQIVDAITLARLIAAEIDAAQNDPAGAIDLGYTPVAQDQFVFLDRAGTATAPTVQSGAAGIVLNNEAQFVRRATLEFDSDGETDPDHIAVPFTLSDSADTLSARVVEVLNTDAADQVVGLEAGSQFIVNGPIEIDANADAELTVTVTPNSSLEVRGEPTVTAGSTIQVFGPLVLDMPDLGGFSIINGSVLTVTDDLGNETVFQFILPLSNLPPLAGAIVVDYDSADSAEDLAANLALVINTAGLPGITATVVNEDQVELGRIDRDRVANTGIAAFPGATSITIFRGIVSDGEVITIRQGDIEVSYEFENVDIGDGVAQGNVQVSFQSSNSPGEIAETLASAIQTNLLGLRLSPEATVDESGESDGGVRLGDIAGTQIDVSLAPTLNIEGVPGGANAIRVSAGDTAEAIKQRILDQLARLQGLSTTLVGEDRGGAEFFIENAAIIEGPITNYFLPAIKDLAGNDLSPNRDDLTTQFTFLLPGIGFDFGDAPDPVGSVAGRYPTRLSADGARHVVSDNGPFLGSSIDGEPDALAVITADGDDLTIGVELSPLPDGVRPLFQLADDDLFAGSVAIEIIPPIDGNQAIRARDGDTITITTGIRSAILEVDTDGLFDEDNFAISLPDAQQSDDVPVADIAAALTQAIQEAQAADQLEGNVLPPQMNADGNLIVELSGDDEDGVRFTSERNPVGIFDRGVWTPIDVELSGTGFLEAWIDFNADGDWDDPGELIISGDESLLTQANATIIGLLKPDELETAIFTPADIAAAARFAIAEGESEIRTFFITVPDTAPDTNGDTYARFRVSTSGTGSPTGLALSGEVEDYLVSVTGSMPTQVPQVASGTTRSYSVFEDSLLDAGDEDGTSVSGPIDDGLLVGLVGNGDLQIFDGDVGTRTLTVRGDTIVDGQVEQIPVGELTVNSNGTFQFRPATDFNGPVSFSVRVQDVDTGLVAPSQVTASIDVRPVNDAPERRDDVPGGQVIVNRTIFEDNATSLTDPTILNEGRVILSAETLVIDGETLTGLIDPFFVPGPENESDQTLVFRSVFGAGDLPTSINQSTVTSLGGIVTISGDGRSLIYQPPVDRDTG